VVETVEWTEKGVVMIDQTVLPVEERYVTLTDVEGVAEAIRTMKVRGAPAIGVAAAMGLALAAQAADPERWLEDLEAARRILAATRPTAVNLFWALERMMRKARTTRDPHELIAEAQAIKAEDIAMNEAMGRHGAELIPDGATVLTHCNAGALATAGFGTALGVIRAAHLAGKDVKVFADETRPFLQGARLTAWELMHDGVPVTLITDNMAAFFMKNGRIDLVITGADRIAANGDTANKIGTYGVAVLARHHGIPFYVAAPSSTFDLSLPSGEQIPIERRNPAEVTHLFGSRVAPEGVAVENPAFDVTPAELIAGIVCEHGVLRPPYVESIRAALGSRSAVSG
jgi:methylthioribose-1-phosphate isomerase